MKTQNIIQILILLVAIIDIVTGLTGDLGLSEQAQNWIKLVGLVLMAVVGHLNAQNIKEVKTFFKK